MIEIKRKLIIFGAGNFAEEVLDIAIEAGFEVECFVEGINRNLSGKKIKDIPVIWIDDITNYNNSHLFLCGIGSPKRKQLIEKISRNGLDFINVIHPTAHISSSTKMGKDIFVSAGSIIAAACSIGNHVIINRAAIIGHHVNIENYVTISPGANIGGNTSIGEGSYIGIGAIVLDHISIGRNTIVGAGAVVTKNVPDFVQVLGIPARINKELS